jgi:hypothetical protein
MRIIAADGAYQAQVTRAGALVIAPVRNRAGAPRFSLGNHAGALPPPMLHDPRLEPLDQAGRWRLVCREGTFEFSSRGLEVHEPLPGLFDEALAEYALRGRDRAVVRWLLRFVRLPGGARLLRAWQARRGR